MLSVLRRHGLHRRGKEDILQRRWGATAWELCGLTFELTGTEQGDGICASVFACTNAGTLCRVRLSDLLDSAVLTGIGENMDQPTGILGISIPGENLRRMYPFETLHIARGVITLSAWAPRKPHRPIDALTFRLADMENGVVIEVMADQALRTKIATAPEADSKT